MTKVLECSGLIYFTMGEEFIGQLSPINQTTTEVPKSNGTLRLNSLF